jgi:hypothetical protein
MIERQYDGTDRSAPYDPPAGARGGAERFALSVSDAYLQFKRGFEKSR